jgi:16S rRNA (uracil1498-N3)-methyltransferase
MNFYRFYVPDLCTQAGSQSSGEVALPEDQAHHAQAVLRLEAGARVVLFDGQGAWVEAIVAQVSKNRVRLSVTENITLDPPPTLHLSLLTAVPKGERAEWLIEQASQLNVAVVQWLDCERSVVKPREGGQKLEKWARLAIESAKQCGRTHILTINPPTPLHSLLNALPAAGTKVLWLEPRPGGKTVAQALTGMAEHTLSALIGPEGGWSDRERELLEQAAQQGWLERVRLTPTVLRIETACAAVAAIIMSH